MTMHCQTYEDKAYPVEVDMASLHTREAGTRYKLQKQQTAQR